MSVRSRPFGKVRPYWSTCSYCTMATVYACKMCGVPLCICTKKTEPNLYIITESHICDCVVQPVIVCLGLQADWLGIRLCGVFFFQESGRWRTVETRFELNFMSKYTPLKRRVFGQ